VTARHPDVGSQQRMEPHNEATPTYLLSGSGSGQRSPSPCPAVRSEWFGEPRASSEPDRRASPRKRSIPRLTTDAGLVPLRAHLTAAAYAITSGSLPRVRCPGRTVMTAGSRPAWFNPCIENRRYLEHRRIAAPAVSAVAGGDLNSLIRKEIRRNRYARGFGRPGKRRGVSLCYLLNICVDDLESAITLPACPHVTGVIRSITRSDHG
jgi:hypothetical protein